MRVMFFCRGLPVTKGSMRAFINRRTGRAIITDNSPKTKPWERAIRDAALQAIERPLDGPLKVDAIFSMQRPTTVPRQRLGWPCDTRNDLDKLLRALLDGMTGVAFHDDGQVVSLDAKKIYSDRLGVSVTITPMECEHAGPRYRDGRCRDCGDGGTA